MTFTQGGDPDTASEYVTFRRIPRLYRMLRLRHVFEDTVRGIQVKTVPDPLPRLKLIRDYVVHTGRNEILTALTRPEFDPARKVILESVPSVVPAGPAGLEDPSPRLLDSSTDHLTVQVDLTRPAILLVTDGYSKDYRAVALPGSSRAEYRVMPANYVLMAVPLPAGHHFFRLEYRPRSLVVGMGVSLAALLLYAGCLVLAVGRARRSGG